MKKTTRIALTALASGALITGGATVAQAAPADESVAAYRVPTSEAATTTTWSTDRMQSAIPAETLIADDLLAGIESTVVEVGDAVSVVGQQALGLVEPAATEVSPVSHIGKVFFTLGGTDYVCSGNSVASGSGNVVSTAGHCLNEGPGAYATEWTFVPAYENGSAPYGQWPATDLVAPDEWVSGGDLNYDTGFAVVASPTGASLADTVGASGVAFNQAENLDYTLYGYPAAAPFDGETLQSCAGGAQTDTFGGSESQGVSCDMTGGSSGGPWFIGSGPNGTQNSVNSFGYTFQPNVMYGPYWGSVIQSAYDAVA